MARTVTVSCAEGEEGYVYEGILPFQVKKTNLKNLNEPQTKIMMNVGKPESLLPHPLFPMTASAWRAKNLSLTHYIKIHPLA